MPGSPTGVAPPSESTPLLNDDGLLAVSYQSNGQNEGEQATVPAEANESVEVAKPRVSKAAVVRVCVFTGSQRTLTGLLSEDGAHVDRHISRGDGRDDHRVVVCDDRQ